MSGYVVAKYLRLSSEDVDLKHTNKLESNSISNQRDLLDSHIGKIPEFCDATVIEFCDDGWSGKNFERPAVQKMLNQVKEGKIQCIVVKDLSRFGRDYLTVGNYLSRIFPFLGVRFIAVNDGFDSIRPLDIDSLDTSFKALIYDLYSRELSRKVRSAKRQRAERGDFLSSHAPYGYALEPGKRSHLVVDPPAAEVVRRIFLMVGCGLSAIQVAKKLNSECVPTPMLYKLAAGCSRRVYNNVHEENFWTDSAIVRIIRDERYLGKVVFGKRFYDRIGQSHSVKVSRENWIVVEDRHEQIVSQEEFDRAQANLREFVEKDGVVPTHFMRRMVRCGVCGHVMYRENVKRPYYFCRTSRLTDNFPCQDSRIGEDDVLSVILDDLHAQAKLAITLSRIWEEQHRAKKKDASATAKRLCELQRRVQQRKQEVKELYESLVVGGISKDEYIAKKASLVKEIDTLSVNASRLEAELENCGTNDELQNGFVDSFAQFSDVQELTDEIVGTTLKSVYIYPDNRLEIIWDHQDDLQRLMLELNMAE